MTDLVAGLGDTRLAGRTWSRPDWTVAELVAAKAGRTISVVLPALNEAETIGTVIDSITGLPDGLVDELIVLDSGSTDDTEIRSIAAGARVVSREQAVAEVAPQPGKGEALWRSLAATTGDIVVFIDSDLIDPDPMFVPNLVGPLLTCDGIHLVKGFYRRPLKVNGTEACSTSFSFTRWKSRCMISCLNGWRWISRSSTLWMVPSRFRSMIEE